MIRRHGPAVAVMLAIAAALEGAARAGVLPAFIPAPSVLVQAVMRQPDLLIVNGAATARTAVAGYLAAIGVAFLAAISAVTVTATRKPLYNTGLVMQSIPLIAAAPLLATWMGGGIGLQVTIAALSSQFPILVGTMQGLRAASTSQMELMQVLSASRLQALRYVMAPMAAPTVFAGLKIAAPGAVLGAITGEWTGSERGLGAVMLYALFSYDIVKVWLAVLATCALAALGYAAMAAVEHRLVFWDRAVDPLAGAR